MARTSRSCFGVALALALPATAAAQHPEIAKRRSAEQKTFTDAQIVEGFFKLALGSEFQMSGRSDRIRKFDGPVRIFVDNRGKPNRSKQVAEVAADIQRRVEHIDLAIIETRAAANVRVVLVRDRDLSKTIQSTYGPERARRIQKALMPQCLSMFRRNETFRIVEAEAILVTDAGEFVFYDCAYEEILQALGPINDDSSVPWSMFNDKVRMGFFGVYDQYILNILYHPRIRPGMTRAEVEAVLPVVMPDVRSFVAKTNGLPP